MSYEPSSAARNIAIDQREGGLESLSSVDDDELKSMAFKASAIEIIQESFPGRLGFTVDLAKVNDFFFAIGGDA